MLEGGRIGYVYKITVGDGREECDSRIIHSAQTVFTVKVK